MSSSNNVINLEKAFHARIREIQRDLNAPKSEWNSFESVNTELAKAF